MAFVDVTNKNGEVQTVPEHYLTAFPNEFKPADSKGSATKSPAKAATSKES